MKKVLLLASLLLFVACKEEKAGAKEKANQKSATSVKKAPNSVTGKIISWGYDGPEGMYATITILSEEKDTVYGFFLDEFGSAAEDFYKIGSKDYGEVSSAYKGKTVTAKLKQPPHAYSLDKEDKTVLFTSVTLQ